MTILESNLAALGSRFPDLAATLQSDAATTASDVTLEVTPSGFFTAKNTAGQYLHSARDPVKEARQLAAALVGNVPESHEWAYVVCGFGLGYPTLALHESGVRWILVVEPNIARFVTALATVNLTALLSDINVGLLFSAVAEDVTAALEHCPAKKVVFVSHPELLSGETPWLDNIKSAIEHWNTKIEINANTLARFGRLWTRNIVANYCAPCNAGDLGVIEGSLHDLPALVCAGGPSLDEILPFIGELRSRFVVISVDTACRALAECGVTPDFVVVSDPQFWNYQHIAGLHIESAIMVAESSVWPAAMRMKVRRVLSPASQFPLGKAFDGLAHRAVGLGAGGSVATSAWDLARLACCHEIWLAGLDLGFPGGRGRCASNYFAKIDMAQARRTRPLETAEAAIRCSLDIRKAAAMDGSKVPSDIRFDLFAWWFENHVTRSGTPPTYSLSPRSRYIPGIRTANMDGATSRAAMRKEIDARLDLIANKTKKHLNYNKSSSFLEELCVQLTKVESIADSLLEKNISNSTRQNAQEDLSAQLQQSLQVQHIQSLSCWPYLEFAMHSRGNASNTQDNSATARLGYSMENIRHTASWLRALIESQGFGKPCR